MHTLRTDGDTYFKYNSDFSGDVIITRPHQTGEIAVPFEDLMELVAIFVRKEKTAQLERKSALGVLLEG